MMNLLSPPILLFSMKKLLSELIKLLLRLKKLLLLPKNRILAMMKLALKFALANGFS